MTGTTNNSSGGEGDDARKKRGNSQDEREAFKKVRSEKKTTGSSISETGMETIGNASFLDDSNSPIKERVRLKVDTFPTSGCVKNPLGDLVWDLESAILYLVQIGRVGGKRIDGDISARNGKNPDTTNTLEATTTGKGTEETSNEETSQVVREYLTNEGHSWISFRAAHAGDASTIAQWYRKQQSDIHSRRRKSKDSTNDKQNSRRKVTRRTTAAAAAAAAAAATTTTEAVVETEQEEAELEKQPMRQTPSNEEESARKNNSNASTTIDSDDVEEENVSSSLQLEHWLAEGLGDENTCPFVHGLLAYIHRSPLNRKYENNKMTNPNDTASTVTALTPHIAKEDDNDLTVSNESHHLAAVVLMSLSWAFGKRNLKVEWMSMDSSSLHRNEGLALRQKVWLRIHTLSAMTACQAISVDEELLLSTSAEEEHHVQSEKEQLSDEEEEPLDGAVSRKSSSRKTYFAEPGAE